MTTPSTFLSFNTAIPPLSFRHTHCSIHKASTRQKPTDGKNANRSAIVEPIRKTILENKDILNRKNNIPNAYGSFLFLNKRRILKTMCSTYTTNDTSTQTS